MFENKNVINRVLVFRTIVRLRYPNGSSMLEHLNPFQGLINQNTSLEVPLADDILALLLLGSFPESWEMFVVTLGNAVPQGKPVSLEMMKSSLLNEEARRKDRESIFDHKVLVTEGGSYKGRVGKEVRKTRTAANQGRNRREDPHAFIVGSWGTFRRIVGITGRTKGELMVLSRRRFQIARTPQQQPRARKTCCSLVNITKLIL